MKIASKVGGKEKI
jgi:hypothetical protein